MAYLYLLSATLLVGCTTVITTGIEFEPETTREPIVTPTIKTLSPVDVDSAEATSHRLDAGFPYLHENDRRSSSSTVVVSVVVDVDGRVVDAQAVRGPEQYFDRARAVVLTRRYEPFRRDEKTIPARFTERVAILPAERRPTQHVPFPEGELRTFTVHMQHGACLGTCPVYEVTITGEGTIAFRGLRNVLVNGEMSYKVPRSDVAALLERFKAADFFSLEDEYKAEVTDLSTVTITLEYAGKINSVIDYMGLWVGMPVSVSRLQKEIDRVAGTRRWVDLMPSSLSALKDMGRELDPEYLAERFACAVDQLEDEAITELLQIGVRADGVCTAAFAGNMSAIESAAGMGRLSTFRLLIKGGALKGADPMLRAKILCAAVWSKKPALVREALALKPEVDSSCPWHGTPLAIAASSLPEAAAQDIVHLLAAAGTDPNHRDRDGSVPIHRQGSMAGVRALVGLGADLNARNNAGQTLVLQTWSEDFARALIEAGADTTGVDERGQTLAERAAWLKWPMVLEALERRAATPRSP